MSIHEIADKKIEAAREKILEWGARVKPRESWDEHSWHLLGHALQYAHEAIEQDPTYQRPWTFLADLYHRIGKTELAQQCLAKSYRLATSGPRFPGNFYRYVEQHLRTGYPFDSSGGLNREAPPSWFDEKYRRYWLTTEVAIEGNLRSPASVPTVLLSYVREDRAQVEQLRSDMKERGFAVWKDTHDIYPGQDWERVIREAFEKCDFVLLCFSQRATTKVGFFQVEVREALRRQAYRPLSEVYMIPVRFEKCAIPTEVRKFHWVDLYPDWSEGVEKIASTIRKYIESDMSVQSSSGRSSPVSSAGGLFYTSRSGRRVLMVQTFADRAEWGGPSRHLNNPRRPLRRILKVYGATRHPVDKATARHCIDNTVLCILHLQPDVVGLGGLGETALEIKSRLEGSKFAGEIGFWGADVGTDAGGFLIECDVDPEQW